MQMISRLRNIKRVTVTESQKDVNALRVGILGAANIAGPGLVYPAAKLKSCLVYGIAARNKAKAEKYAQKHNILTVFDDYEDLINSESIDVVYNPLPNGYHAYYTILALKAGKHVLCEKPVASNEMETKAMQEAQLAAPINAKTQTKPLLIEAFHYRFHPLVDYIRELKQDPDFGEIEKAHFRMCAPSLFMSKSDIRFDVNGTIPELAGGTLMDCCYAVDQARLWLGDDIDPVIKSCKMEKVFERIDGAAEAELDFNGKTVGLSVSFQTSLLGFRVDAKIETSTKEIYVFLPIVPFIYHYITIVDKATKKKTTKKLYGSGETTYFYQLETFIEACKGDSASLKKAEFAGGMDKAVLGMKIIDELYKKGGLEPRQGKPLSF